MAPDKSEHVLGQKAAMDLLPRHSTTDAPQEAAAASGIMRDYAGACAFIVEQPRVVSAEPAQTERQRLFLWTKSTLLPAVEDAWDGDDNAWDTVRRLCGDRGIDMSMCKRESSLGGDGGNRSIMIARILQLLNAQLLAPNNLLLTYAKRESQAASIPPHHKAMRTTALGIYDVQSDQTMQIQDVTVPIAFVRLLHARDNADSYYPHYNPASGSIMIPMDLLRAQDLTLRNMARGNARRNAQEPSLVSDARTRHARRLSSLYSDPEHDWLRDTLHSILLHEARHAMTDIRFRSREEQCDPFAKMERYLKPESILYEYIHSADNLDERYKFAIGVDELSAEITAATLSANPKTVLSRWRTTLEIDLLTEQGEYGYEFSPEMLPSREAIHIGTLLLAQKTGMIRHLTARMPKREVVRLWHCITNTTSLLEFQPDLLIEIMERLEKMEPQDIRDALRSIYNDDQFLGGPIDEDPLPQIAGMVPETLSA